MRSVEAAESTTTLWRPVGPEELALIRQTGMRAFPPRLPEQPIFYPVTSGRDHGEHWIPAEELDAFNEAIVGVIEVVHAFGQ